VLRPRVSASFAMIEATVIGWIIVGLQDGRRLPVCLEQRCDSRNSCDD
jgi:hypothetical protein